MDPTAWIAAVTSLGTLVQTWLDAKKSGIELEKARLSISDELSTQAQPTDAPNVPGAAQAPTMVIDQDLLTRLTDDILAAKNRFAAVFNDPRYTPADVDREEERARLCVCAHVKRIREFNAGSLPSKVLENLAVSFRCGA